MPSITIGKVSERYFDRRSPSKIRVEIIENDIFHRLCYDDESLFDYKLSEEKLPPRYLSADDSTTKCTSHMICEFCGSRNPYTPQWFPSTTKNDITSRDRKVSNESIIKNNTDEKNGSVKYQKNIKEFEEPFWIKFDDAASSWVDPDSYSEQLIDSEITFYDKKVFWEMISFIIKYPKHVESRLSSILSSEDELVRFLASKESKVVWLPHSSSYLNKDILSKIITLDHYPVQYNHYESNEV
jgi:hypothetical protein